jgi:hypothetical protein
MNQQVQDVERDISSMKRLWKDAGKERDEWKERYNDFVPLLQYVPTEEVLLKALYVKRSANSSHYMTTGSP